MDNDNRVTQTSRDPENENESSLTSLIIHQSPTILSTYPVYSLARKNQPIICIYSLSSLNNDARSLINPYPQRHDEGTTSLPRAGERRGRLYRSRGTGERDRHGCPKKCALPDRQPAGRVGDRHHRDRGPLHPHGPRPGEAPELQSHGDRREPKGRWGLSGEF